MIQVTDFFWFNSSP